VEEALKEQAASDQEHLGQSNLYDDEAAPEATAPEAVGGPRAALLERSVQVLAGCQQSRNDAGCHSRRQRHQEGEPQNSPI
jgi:hypothetical protein